jgi:hypothetical protein
MSCNGSPVAKISRQLWVKKASPTLTTHAALTPVGRVFDRLRLTGGFNPTGIISVGLYGPNDSNCSQPPIFSSRTRVSGNGVYRSRSFRAPPGVYRFKAAYHLNRNNKAARSPCNAAGESVTVPTG